MISYENKFELSLTSETLPLREAMDNERGNFQKLKKNAKELEPRKPDLFVPVLLESSLVGIPYKEFYKSLPR